MSHVLVKAVWVEATKTTKTAKALYHVNADLAGATGFTGVCDSSLFFAMLFASLLVFKQLVWGADQGFPKKAVVERLSARFEHRFVGRPDSLAAL